MADAAAKFNFCRMCGSQAPKDKKFCTRCGAPVKRMVQPGESSIKCPSCGFATPPDSKFCINCSTSVERQIVVEDMDELAVVRINTDHIDFENAKDLLPSFKKIIRRKIVIDLAQVNWIDSTGIGSLVTLCYKASQSGQEIKIINLAPKVRESIKMLQVDNVLDIHESLNDACASWGLPLI